MAAPVVESHPIDTESKDKVETKDKLEKQLNQRPGRSELVEKNILKDDKGVAPALIANMEKLKRSQLENKLDHALQHRPKPDELVKDGILQEGEAPAV